MPSEEKEHKKKRSKSSKLRKQRRNEKLTYARIDGDEEEALAPTVTVPEEPIELPYPEAEGPSQLNMNGNSLPNITHRPKERGVVAQSSMFATTCAARTRDWCRYERCLCLFITAIFCTALFIAGASYEEYEIDHREPPIITDGGADQPNNDHNVPYQPIDPNAPENDPITYTERQKNMIIKMRLLSGDVVSEAGTPHHHAAHWMLWIDESGVSADSPFLWQVSVFSRRLHGYTYRYIECICNF